MIIKKIQERIKCNYTEEELQEYSKFFLARYVKYGNETELSEVLPINNNIDPFELEEGLVLTDASGNVLIDNSESDKSILIHAVNNNRILAIYRDIIYKRIGKEYHNSKAVFYEYDGKKLKEIETISDKKSSFDIDMIRINDEVPTLIINESNNGEKTSYLYSMEQNRRISPIVTSIEPVLNTDGRILKYHDTIKSSQKYKGENIKNTIIGFMNLNGSLYNNIFDSRINDIRNIELNTHPNFMQYKALKNALTRELDEEVEERIEKDHLKNAAIKRLELQAKNNK